MNPLHFLIRPQKAFRSLPPRVRTGFMYLALWLLISAVLSSLLGGVVKGITTYVMGLLGTVVLGFWLHFWAYLAGSRHLETTLKIVLYGSTPTYLLGWLATAPGGRYLQLIPLIWSLVLFGIGLMTLSKFSGPRAALTVIVAAVVGFLLLGGMAYFTITTFLPLIFALG